MVKFGAAFYGQYNFACPLSERTGLVAQDWDVCQWFLGRKMADFALSGGLWVRIAARAGVGLWIAKNSLKKQRRLYWSMAEKLSDVAKIY